MNRIFNNASFFSSKRRERRAGVAALEFALTLPIWCTLLFLSIEAARLMLISQRIDRVAYTVSDIVTQSEVLNHAGVQVILGAAAEIMQPIDFNADGVVIVTSVSRASGAAVPARIDWQQTGGGALAGQVSRIGTAVGAVPNFASLNNLALNQNENVIVTEVFYDYQPLFGLAMPGIFEPFPRRTIYRATVYKPRLSPLSVLGQ